jgi:uncharacterized protein YjbI with pentapeptide repeats
MALNEHVKLLKKSAEAWNASRLIYPEMVPDLGGANLSGLDLMEVDLSGGNLNGADFSGAKLQRANISAADLRDANLNGIDLRHALLISAKLNGSMLKTADLRGAQFNDARLGNTDLTGANIASANFMGADLHNADLSDATLTRADFRRTDLRQVKFINTIASNLILIAADLRDSVLCGANFFGADLHQADFSRANLSGADFTDAVIGGTTFVDTDLGSAKGLDRVRHSGRSTIGIETLINSKGKVPDVFLRGLGLPENFITYLPSLLAQPIEFYSCFISYSHSDKSFARRLHDSLQGRGIRCWLDEHELLPGDKIYSEVDRGIRLWDKVLLCCSEDALNSWWVDNEIKIAFDKEQQLWRKRKKEVLALIPLNLDDYLFNGWQSGLAVEVKARLAANFMGWEHDNEKFEEQFERLVTALRADGAGKQSPPPSLL